MHIYTFIGYKFTYRQNRSTKDGVVTLLNLIQTHLGKSRTIAQAFYYFTSAFLIMQPELILTKMMKMENKSSLIQWYHLFLIDFGRLQIVMANQRYSNPIVTYSGAPQGCVSSPFLFTLYTDNCQTDTVNTYIHIQYIDIFR